MRALLISRAVFFVSLHTSWFIVSSQDVSLPPYPILSNSSTAPFPRTGPGMVSDPSSITMPIGTKPVPTLSTGMSGAPPNTTTDLSLVDPTLSSNRTTTTVRSSTGVNGAPPHGTSTEILSSVETTVSSNATATTVSSGTGANGTPPHGTSTDLPSSIDITPTSNGKVTTRISSDISGGQITSGATSSVNIPTSSSNTVTSIDKSSSIDSIALPPKPTDSSSTTSDIVLPPDITLPPGHSSTTSDIILPPGITLPPDPSTTIPPTGIEIQSSASDMSVIIVGVFPLLREWIKDPQDTQATAVTNRLKDILPKASKFLGKLPKPTDGVEPCKHGKHRRTEEAYQGLQTLEKRSFLGGLFKTAFSLVTCVIDTTNKIKDGVQKEATDTVQTLLKDLKPMADALNEADPNEPEPSGANSNEPTSTQSESSSSSSSSCSLSTVSNCNIACTATATTTIGGAKRRADKDACTTVCDAPITKCGITGITSTSTVTSTTTTAKKCAKGCSACNAPIPPLEPITGGNILTDTNGIFYVPATTISALPTEAGEIGVPGSKIAPQETGTPDHSLRKRTLTNPRDRPFNGDVGDWLLAMVAQPGIKNLEHGNAPDWFTTSITDPLLNERASWYVRGMVGCTAIVVISRRRMFMAHIWQDPTMENSNGHFERDALDVFRNADGDGRGVRQGLSAFTGPGGDFENTVENKVRAIIITPYNDESSDPQPDDLKYPDEVKRIKDMLKKTLHLSNTMPVLSIPYEVRGDDVDEDGNKLPHGNILVQYDPEQAIQQVEGQSCQTQVAQIEVWVEELDKTPRYDDSWLAMANQVVATQPGPSRRLLRGKEVIEADEEEWQEYGSILRRQNGVCARPSGTLSASSTNKNPSTFQTSFITTTSVGDGIAPEPRTSSSAPEPEPTLNKVLSVVMQKSSSGYNSWKFFETWIDTLPELCGPATLDSGVDTPDQPSIRWTDPEAIKSPPWPQGTFTMKLNNEDNCQYLNDGNGAGILHCPSLGDGNNMRCYEDTDRRKLAITECETHSANFDFEDFSMHKAVYCPF